MSRGGSDFPAFIISFVSLSAELMEASNSSRVMVVQVLLLALVLQVTLSQHWSYGWLPGGKRSVGELEATIRVSISFVNIFRLCRNVVNKSKTCSLS